MNINTFLNKFLQEWSSSSLEGLSELISKDYQAREISRGEPHDFGYDQSIEGWEQGFNFVKENNAEWKLDLVQTISLREDECMAVISATIIVDGKQMETANLFFNTFKMIEGYWKLDRSYIEVGITNTP